MNPDPGLPSPLASGWISMTMPRRRPPLYIEAALRRRSERLTVTGMILPPNPPGHIAPSPSTRGSAAWGCPFQPTKLSCARAGALRRCQIARTARHAAGRNRRSMGPSRAAFHQGDDGLRFLVDHLGEFQQVGCGLSLDSPIIADDANSNQVALAFAAQVKIQFLWLVIDATSCTWSAWVRHRSPSFDWVNATCRTLGRPARCDTRDQRCTATVVGGMYCAVPFSNCTRTDLSSCAISLWASITVAMVAAPVVCTETRSPVWIERPFLSRMLISPCVTVPSDHGSPAVPGQRTASTVFAFPATRGAAPQTPAAPYPPGSAPRPPPRWPRQDTVVSSGRICRSMA